MAEQIINSDNNNSDFFYEFTKRKLDKTYESIDEATKKLIAIIGFSGFLLRFTIDLPHWKYIFFPQLLASLFAVAAIAFAASGLKPKEYGPSIDPADFLEPEMYRESEEICKLYVGRQWLKTIEKADELLTLRLSYLSHSITCLILASIVFGISIPLSIIIQ